MKQRQFWLLILFISIFSTTTFSQQIAINEDGSLPHSSAILDVKSYNRGVLFPRMSTHNRQSIVPATGGLMVYDTTTRSFWIHNGTSWQNIVTGAPNSTGSWTLTGNIGTDETNFIGTTDTKSLRFKVNGNKAGLIDYGHGVLFLGYRAGEYNTFSPIDSGRRNTGLGAFALFSNVSGKDNTATGSEALLRNLRGVENTATGSSTLSHNENGNKNTAIGYHAMYYNTSGYSNTASGHFAMHNSTTGIENTATGANSLLNNGGSYNTATGYAAMGSNLGSYNTATGHLSMYQNTSGWDNTSSGWAALYQNTTGYYNTALGSAALYRNITGSRNTAVGNHADVMYPDLSNATAIGFNAVVNASNKVRIGNSAVTRIEGQVPFSTPSDQRFKYGVKEDVKGLDFIMQLRPVTYYFDVKRFDDKQRGMEAGNTSSSIDATMKEAYEDATAIRRSGFLAQEVEKAADAVGYDFSGVLKPKGENDHYGLSYESFVVPLVKAMQELNKKLDDLKAENESLKKQITQLAHSK